MENLDILIYAALTVFLISRLWAVLGQQDDEPSQPKTIIKKQNRQEDEENVLILEIKNKPAKPNVLTQNGHAPTSLAGNLDAFRGLDPDFSEKEFLEGAKVAFEKIVACYAAGDLTPVAWLLGPSVRQPFEKAMAARKGKGQTLENEIRKIAAADIVDARIEEDRFGILGVEFVSHQINILKDENGNILDGDKAQTEEVRDFWVFRRDLKSNDPNWVLVETRA